MSGMDVTVALGADHPGMEQRSRRSDGLRTAMHGRHICTHACTYARTDAHIHQVLEEIDFTMVGSCAVSSYALVPKLESKAACKIRQSKRTEQLREVMNTAELPDIIAARDLEKQMLERWKHRQVIQLSHLTIINML